MGRLIVLRRYATFFLLLKNEKSLQQLDLDAQAATRVVAIVCARPSLTGLSQEKPFLFELGVGGKDMKSKIEYVRGLLGKEIPSSEVLKPGMFVDAIAVSKGKGFEGPVTRHGIKRKQHKSRKSVRAVGVIGPWNPTTMMYTVPRAGQHGLNQRTEYNAAGIEKKLHESFAENLLLNYWQII